MTTSNIQYSKTSEKKVFLYFYSLGKTLHLIMTVLSKHFLPFLSCLREITVIAEEKDNLI